MKKLLVGAALAVSMLAAAPAANAATAITLPAPSADGTLSYGYTQALGAPVLVRHAADARHGLCAAHAAQ